jgi:hypothetical protein
MCSKLERLPQVIVIKARRIWGLYHKTYYGRNLQFL